MKKRGVLNEGVKNISKNFLGEEITQTELRLYPFLDYIVKNSNYFDRRKINAEEMAIISQREDEGHLVLMGDKLFLTRAFYDYMNAVLAESYVVFKEELNLSIQ